MTRINFVWIVLIILAMVSGGVATYFYIQLNPAPMWLPMRTMTGRGWLKITDSERVLFVYGYRNGHSAGILAACLHIAELTGHARFDDTESLYYKCRRLVDQDWPDPEAGIEIKGVPNSFTVVEMITALYAEYPQYRNYVTVGLIIEFGSGLTLEEFLLRNENRKFDE